MFGCDCWCLSGRPSWSAASLKCPPAVWLLGQMTWIVRGQDMFLVLKRMRAAEHQFIIPAILIFVIHVPLLCKNLGKIVSYVSLVICVRMLLPPAVHQWSRQTYLELASILLTIALVYLTCIMLFKRRLRSLNQATSCRPPYSRCYPRLPDPANTETNAAVLKRRQKQIQYGKNTSGYQNYLLQVPK